MITILATSDWNKRSTYETMNYYRWNQIRTEASVQYIKHSTHTIEDWKGKDIKS